MTHIDSAPAATHDGSLARIVAFARKASFETTHLSAAQIAEVKAVAPPGTAIYVAAIPSRPLAEQTETVRDLRAAGYEPVPHLVARNFSSLAEMDAHVARMADEAGVRTALVIAGDRPEPAGPFFDALAIIRSGVLEKRGITDIGISSYPDGHPRIDDAMLDKALDDKLAAARDAGLAVRIVTQFTMAAEPYVALLRRLRSRGIDNPVSVGLAGPTSMTTLLRFAKICGVKTSMQGLTRNIGLVKNLIGSSTSAPIVKALAERPGEFGDIAPHFFSFGGLPATVRWGCAVMAGRISPTKDGFEVQS